MMNQVLKVGKYPLAMLHSLPKYAMILSRTADQGMLVVDV
jgi:hypothetical protein